MRLTLRTLLAWIDGVLLPEEHDLIGSRVAGSRVATRLGERMRAVVVKPGLGVPQSGGHWIADDPNFVAEYLDNTLESVHLESFERFCIESDPHLAEVAACHGLLADLSRDRETERALKAQDRESLKDRTKKYLVWLRVQKAGEAVTAAASPERARTTAMRESQETARALVQAMMVDTAGTDATSTAAAVSPAAPVAVPPRLPAAVGEMIARGVRGIEAVAAAATTQPSALEPDMVPAAGEGGQRGSFAVWMTAGFAFTLLLALGGALVSSMNISRAFEPEAGCFRCTEP